MSISPYLFFNGDCRAALTRYGEIFGTAPEFMDASGMPPEFQVPGDRKEWIMHGSVGVAGGTLMASDDMTGTAAPMAGAAVQCSFATVAEAKPVFDALAEGGEITMPFDATFWSAGFGMLTDRFGVKWLVNSEAPPA